MVLTIFLEIMLLIFFHEKYQELSVVLSDFKGLEKYRQYRENHWEKGWWDARQKKPTSVETVGGKNKRKISG